MEISLSQKYGKLQKILSRHKQVAIAFSGGVDSSFLLYAACAAIGSSAVHAFHAKSELLPPTEAGRVERTVNERGCRFHPVEIDPLGWPEFVANAPDRCYLCKKNIYQTFLTDHSFPTGALLFDGTNRDDLGQERPGLQAVAELRVQTPLADIGFTKQEIRLLSRDFALSTWNVHASSCLATRIAHNEPITREKIVLVSRCEALLQEHGFMGVRVRLSQKTASIAVQQKDLLAVQKKHVFSAINDGFMSLGVSKVIVDSQGRYEPLG